VKKLALKPVFYFHQEITSLRESVLQAWTRRPLTLGPLANPSGLNTQLLLILGEHRVYELKR